MEASDVIEQHIDRVEGEPIRWGRDDCAMFCADVLKDLHGIDLGKGWRRKYRTAAGARRVLGKGSLLRSVARTMRRHGWQRLNPQDALPGDLGMLQTATGDAACVVCLAKGWWVGRIERGVTYARQSPKFAWGAPRG